MESLLKKKINENNLKKYITQMKKDLMYNFNLNIENTLVNVFKEVTFRLFSEKKVENTVIDVYLSEKYIIKDPYFFNLIIKNMELKNMISTKKYDDIDINVYRNIVKEYITKFKSTTVLNVPKIDLKLFELTLKGTGVSFDDDGGDNYLGTGNNNININNIKAVC